VRCVDGVGVLMVDGVDVLMVCVSAVSKTVYCVDADVYT
jgi:hypothetical protein